MKNRKASIKKGIKFMIEHKAVETKIASKKSWCSQNNGWFLFYPVHIPSDSQLECQGTQGCYKIH